MPIMPLFRKDTKEIPRKCGNMSFECEECGEEFESTGKLAAHTRWEHGDDENEDENTQKDLTTDKTIEEPESDFYAGKAGQLEVKDLDEPEARCPECENAVRPGKNCQNCGEKLDWS